MEIYFQLNNLLLNHNIHFQNIQVEYGVELKHRIKENQSTTKLLYLCFQVLSLFSNKETKWSQVVSIDGGRGLTLIGRPKYLKVKESIS